MLRFLACVSDIPESQCGEGLRGFRVGSCRAHRLGPLCKTPTTLSHLGVRQGPGLRPHGLLLIYCEPARLASLMLRQQPHNRVPPRESALSPCCLEHSIQDLCPVLGGTSHPPALTPALPGDMCQPRTALEVAGPDPLPEESQLAQRCHSAGHWEGCPLFAPRAGVSLLTWKDFHLLSL